MYAKQMPTYAGVCQVEGQKARRTGVLGNEFKAQKDKNIWEGERERERAQ